MLRKLFSLFVAGILGLGCIGGAAFGQTGPVGPGNPGVAPQQQYYPLTLQSLPQMLQQTGYQIQPMSDQVGPYWRATNPQTGQSVNIFPQKTAGNLVRGLLFGSGSVIPHSGITQQQIQTINASLAPTCKLDYYAPKNTLIVVSYLNHNDSNAQELKNIIADVMAKTNLASQMLNGGAGFPVVNPTPAPVAPVVNPTPAPVAPVAPVVNPMPAPVAPVAPLVPVAVTSVANTTWAGKEKINGVSWTDIRFQFQQGGQVTMTCPQGTYYGTWTQFGNQVTITLPVAQNTFTGFVNGNTFSGQGKDNKNVTWDFNVSLAN